jgi:hypothetical protein
LHWLPSDRLTPVTPLQVYFQVINLPFHRGPAVVVIFHQQHGKACVAGFFVKVSFGPWFRLKSFDEIGCGDHLFLSVDQNPVVQQILSGRKIQRDPVFVKVALRLLLGKRAG